MATAKKLPSGRWRVLVYDYTDPDGNRKYKSFTADTKKEAEFLAVSYKMEEKAAASDTGLPLSAAVEKYCGLKSNVLSPATLREYRRLGRYAYGPLEDKPLEKITTAAVQAWANAYALDHSPKSVKNACGLLHSIFKAFRPGLGLNVTLPQKVKTDLYVPTDADVRAVLDYFAAKDAEMEKAILLAAYGTLRRSEIAALMGEDIQGNVIRVSKAVVDAGKSDFKTKTTKTASSTRDVEMPDFVIEKLPKSGRVVGLNPNQISSRFARSFKHTGIKPFRFHDLRHYAASMMHALGIPDQYIMERGGWASDAVLKRIYRGVMQDYKERFTSALFGHMQHEMQHTEKDHK